MELAKIYSSTGSMIKNRRSWLNPSIQSKVSWMQRCDHCQEEEESSAEQMEAELPRHPKQALV